MSKVPSGNNKWIKAADVTNGETVKIISEADWQESTFNGQTQNQYVGKVLHKGEEKNFKFTMKSCQNLSQAFGDDSKEWVGKEITLQIKEMEVGGRDVKSIRAFPATETQSVKTPAEVWDE